MTKNDLNSAAASGIAAFICLSALSCTTTPAPQRAVVHEAAPIQIIEAAPLKQSDSIPVTTSANVKAAHEEVEKQLAKIQNQNSSDGPADEPTVVLKPAPAAEVQDINLGIEPTKALGWLKNGNIRFLKQRLRSDGQSPADIRRLARRQKPHTVVVSCSDSRVPPEIIFDQKLGELFVIRTSSEILDSSVIESVESALSYLGTRHVLILGHSDRIAEKTACANTKSVVTELQNRSRLVRQMQAEKKIMISTAIYDLENGKVDFTQ